MISRWFEKCRMLRVLVITQIEMPENTMEQNAKEAWAELIFAHHFRASRLISRLHYYFYVNHLDLAWQKIWLGKRAKSIFIRYKKCMCEKKPSVRLLFYEGGTKCRRGWLWHVNTRQCNPLLTNFWHGVWKNIQNVSIEYLYPKIILVQKIYPKIYLLIFVPQ